MDSMESPSFNCHSPVAISPCRLKLTQSRQEIWLAALGTWYKELSEKKKKSFTLKKLKRRAMYEAEQIFLEAQRIPKDWMEIMERDYGLKIYKRVKEDKNNVKPEQHINLDDEDEIPKETPKVEMKDVKVKKEMIRTSCGRLVKPTEAILLTRAGEYKMIKSNEIIDLTHDDYDGKSSKDVNTAKSTKPKILDKSEDPPPAWWIEKYYKTGIAPPRELRIHTFQDKAILWHDYDLPEDYYSKFKKRENAESDTDTADTGTKQVRYAHDVNITEWWTTKCEDD